MIPISLLRALCAAAGVSPDDVYAVEATTTTVTFQCHSRDSFGHKFLGADHDVKTHFVDVPIDWKN